MGMNRKLEDPAGASENEEVVYKNKVVFLRKSRAGDHLFVHDSREDLEKGATLIMNVAEVKELIGGSREWIKVSILPREEETSAETAGSARV